LKTIDTSVALLGFILYLVAAYGDLTKLRIPNLLVAAVAVLAVGRLILIGDPSAALYTVGAALIVFFVGAMLFRFGLLGGGDVKLLSATVLLIGYQDILGLLAMMSVCGAILALLVWLDRQTLHPSRVRLVPYGVAISLAGIATLFVQSFYFG
jgi:prepilin peptidase CpaA